MAAQRGPLVRWRGNVVLCGGLRMRSPCATVPPPHEQRVGRIRIPSRGRHRARLCMHPAVGLGATGSIVAMLIVCSMGPDDIGALAVLHDPDLVLGPSVSVYGRRRGRETQLPG